jgi:large subunit ribosomal protein L3
MNTHPGILGKKLGMMQVFLEDGTVVPCTVIQAGCTVVGKRTKEKDGYDALILGLGEAKPKTRTKAERTQYEKLGQKAPSVVKELRCAAEHAAKYEIGHVVKIEDVFEEGQKVDVQAKSRGRGFQGVFRRHHMAGLNKTHGTHEWRRHGGSIGTNMTPGRVLKGLRMPGQMGNKAVSVLNQKVTKLLVDQQIILLEGNVPGALNTIVRVQGAVKKRGGKAKPAKK